MTRNGLGSASGSVRYLFGGGWWSNYEIQHQSYKSALGDVHLPSATAATALDDELDVRLFLCAWLLYIDGTIHRKRLAHI